RDHRIHRVGGTFARHGLTRPRTSGVGKSGHICVCEPFGYRLEASDSRALPEAGRLEPETPCTYRPTTGRAGIPALPRPAPATTPTPRLIISCNSSLFDEEPSAVSRLIIFFM